MGLASEIDILLRKQKEVDLTIKELKQLKELWEGYREFNKLYGKEIRSFEELWKEVMLLGKEGKPKGS